MYYFQHFSIYESSYFERINYVVLEKYHKQNKYIYYFDLFALAESTKILKVIPINLFKFEF